MRCCYYLLESNRRFVLAVFPDQRQRFFFGAGQFISTMPTKIIIKPFQILFLAQCSSTARTYKKRFLLTADCPAAARTRVKFFKFHNYNPPRIMSIPYVQLMDWKNTKSSRFPTTVMKASQHYSRHIFDFFRHVQIKFL